MKYKTGMVYGIYDKIEERHANLLKRAAELCDTVFVAVSSDEEIQELTKEPSRVPIEQRAKTVDDFCKQERINARILALVGKTPMDVTRENTVDAYILSESQYQRFGKELEGIIKDSQLLGKIEVVKV